MYPASQLKTMFYTPPVLTLDPRQYFISNSEPSRTIVPNHPPSASAPFAECPQDIARFIFEIAIMSRPLPIQLTLVSRQVKEWLDPLIYRNLSFHNTLSFRSFYWKTFRTQGGPLSKDNTSYRKHVKGLFVHAYTDSSLLAAMVSEMNGLESLSLLEKNTGEDALRRILRTCPGAGSWRGARTRKRRFEDDPFPFTNLRRLSFSSFLLESYVIPKVEPVLTHPFFKDLTHIDIVYFSQFASWEYLHHLQNLTHLSFNDMASPLRHPSSRIWDSWMMRLLEACPPSVKVVIFGCIDTYNYAFFELDGDERELGALMLVEFAEFMEGSSSSRRPECHFNYHAISRLIAGWMDPRAVAGCMMSRHDLPVDYALYNHIVDTSHPLFGPKPDIAYQALTEDELVQDSWSVAEGLIKRREEHKRIRSSA